MLLWINLTCYFDTDWLKDLFFIYQVDQIFAIIKFLYKKKIFKKILSWLFFMPYNEHPEISFFFFKNRSQNQYEFWIINNPPKYRILSIYKESMDGAPYCIRIVQPRRRLKGGYGWRGVSYIMLHG